MPARIGLSHARVRGVVVFAGCRMIVGRLVNWCRYYLLDAEIAICLVAVKTLSWVQLSLLRHGGRLCAYQRRVVELLKGETNE